MEAVPAQAAFRQADLVQAQMHEARLHGGLTGQQADQRR